MKTANNKALIDGVVISMGGIDYTVPPLNLAGVKKVLASGDMAELQNVKGVPSADQIGVISRIAILALNRNYPDLTIEELEELLDLGNAMQIIRSVMGVSGFVARGEGSGEAVAAN
jgi:hypothetical protein